MFFTAKLYRRFLMYTNDGSTKRASVRSPGILIRQYHTLYTLCMKAMFAIQYSNINTLPAHAF